MSVLRIAVLILAGLALTAQEPVGLAGKGGNFFSLEKEAALGRQLAAEFRKRTTPIDKPTVQNYLDRLGKRLAAHVPDATFPFTFSAIAEDLCPTIHEPAALPGGYVFVPAALFIAAQDEAEFAGMLAHAMEHIAQRRVTRQATQSQLVSHASTPLIFIGGWGGGCSEEQSIPLAFVTQQRSYEMEADFLAVQVMARAGLDPKALVRYIQRVQVRRARTVSKAYSPVPDRDHRVANMLWVIEKLQTVDYAAFAPDEFAAVQQKMRRLIPVNSHTPPSLMRKTPE